MVSDTETPSVPTTPTAAAAAAATTTKKKHYSNFKRRSKVTVNWFGFKVIRGQESLA